MRDIPEEMAVRIESGAATLCHAWVLTTADGAVQGFTDHDRDLTLAGVLCRAASGWTAGAGEVEAGLANGSLAVGGALDSQALTGADIAAGRYDGARVEAWKVDWMRPDLKVRLWAGTIAKVRQDGDRFLADLQGPMAALERVVGRTYGPRLRRCSGRRPMSGGSGRLSRSWLRQDLEDLRRDLCQRDQFSGLSRDPGR
jgi:hypothetical protein